MDTLTSFFAELKQQIYRKLNIQRYLDERDIYRYRIQRGVNLGSWFVLEKWISAAPFQRATENASSDYDVACSPGAREVLEHHWDTWMTDEDWKWLSERGINLVRLPIGYYHLYAKDRSVVRGTPFEHIGAVFEGAWPRILAALNKAASYGMGVLVDLHAAPGKQNAYPHSGINGPVEFFQKENLSRTIHVLKLLATSLADMPWVVGIELVNEPENNPALECWYRTCLDAIRAAVGPDLPLYIHASPYAALVHERSDFVVLEHHVERYLTTHDHTLSGDQHALLADLAEPTRRKLVFAKFSAPLNPELRTVSQHCGGWWMLPYKKDGGDAGWSYRNAVRTKTIPDQVGRSRSGRGGNAMDRRAEMVSKALHRHTKFWPAAMGVHEHWRFKAGFLQGWEDALLFFMFQPNTAMETPVSELGFVDQWLDRRISEHVSRKGWNKHAWQFEWGFHRGFEEADTYYFAPSAAKKNPAK